MKEILNRLFNQEILTKEEAESTLLKMGRGEYNEYQGAAFLTAYRMRPITGQELAGFRSAMVKLAKHIDLSDFETIDLCGTGGDGKDTFNISTVSSLVVAGAGYKVAKHGNAAISSACGSSNVLQQLGYTFKKETEELRRDIEKGNFCYMHAPYFHPAMSIYGPIRKGLQVKTFFNILGPLINPSRTKRQLTGVYHESIMSLYQAVFEDAGIEYAIVHSIDGYDEISLTGPFKVMTSTLNSTLNPGDFGLPALSAESLYGGKTVKDAAEIFVDILKDQCTAAQKTVVVANAGLAIQRFKPEAPIGDCISEALESIESGQALNMLKNLTS